MSGGYVPAAFSEVLSEFSKAREILVEALARAAGIGDYDAVAELTERLKGADTLKDTIERLEEEWQAVFYPEVVEPELFVSALLDSRTALGVPD